MLFKQNWIDKFKKRLVRYSTKLFLNLSIQFALQHSDLSYLTVSAARSLRFHAVHHGGQNRWHTWNEKITSLSIYVLSGHTRTHRKRQSGLIALKYTYTSICIAHFYAKRITCAQTWITQFYLQITSCLPLLPSRRTSPPFGWYSFTVPRMVEGWVDLGGWLHTEIKCRLRESNPDTVTHPITNCITTSLM